MKVKTPRRMAAWSLMEKRFSTMSSQEALVGSQVDVDAEGALQPAAHLGACGWPTVHHQVQLVIRAHATQRRRAARYRDDGA